MRTGINHEIVLTVIERETFKGKFYKMVMTIKLIPLWMWGKMQIHRLVSVLRVSDYM